MTNRLIRNILKPNIIISIVICVMQPSLINLLLGYIQKFIIDISINRYAGVYMFILMFLLIVYTSLILPFSGRKMEDAQVLLSKNIRTSYLQCLLTGKIKNNDNIDDSTHQYNLRSASNSVSALVSWTFVILLQAIFAGLVALVVIFNESLVLLSILVLIGLIALIVTHITKKYYKVLSETERRYIIARQKLINEFNNNQVLIRTYGIFNSKKTEIEDLNKKLLKAKTRKHYILETSSFYHNISFLVLYPVFIILYFINTNSFGSMFLVLQMSTGLSFMFSSIKDYILNIQKVLIDKKSLDDSFNSFYFVNENVDYVDFKISRISFENVCFSYDDKRENIFNNFSGNCNFPSDYQLLGRNGTGKSTIFKLLLKLYSPDRGRVIINSLNLNDIPTKILLKKIGYVPQFGFIFNDTLPNNILLGRAELPYDELLNIISICELEDMFEKFGLYQNIDSKDLISTGELSRILIARALIQNPEIILLDEFDANLDTETYSKILSNLKKNFDNLSVIHITHKNAYSNELKFKKITQEEGG